MSFSLWLKLLRIPELLSFSVTGVRMVLLLHGQIDTYTQMSCVTMGTHTSRII